MNLSGIPKTMAVEYAPSYHYKRNWEPNDKKAQGELRAIRLHLDSIEQNFIDELQSEKSTLDYFQLFLKYNNIFRDTVAKMIEMKPRYWKINIDYFQDTYYPVERTN